MKNQNRKIRNLFAGAAMATVLCALAQEKAGEKMPSQPGSRMRKPPLVEVVQARLDNLTRDLKVTGEVISTRSVVVAATKEGPISYCP